MDLLLYSTLSSVLFFPSIFLLALASCEEGCQRACCIFQEVSLAFPISPFYSSGLFPFSCGAQPSFKHPISLVLLLLLSLGLHLLYRGFIPPLWLCFLLPFLAYFCLSLFFFCPHSLDFLSSSSHFLLLCWGILFSILFFFVPLGFAILPCNGCSVFISPFLQSVLSSPWCLNKQ